MQGTLRGDADVQRGDGEGWRAARSRGAPRDLEGHAHPVFGREANGNRRPVVHTHLAVGLSEGSAKGGHLIPTLEVMVTAEPVTMRKTFDPETGLALIDPNARHL